MTGGGPRNWKPRVRPSTGDAGLVAGVSRPQTGGGAPSAGRPPTGGGIGRPPTGSGFEMPAGGPAERRPRARRAPYVAPARIVAGTRNFDGRVENVSEAGLMVSLPEGLPDRSSVSARFALPMTRTMVSVPATVVWQLPSRPGVVVAGLEFALLDDTMRRELQRYVELVGEP